MIESRLIDKATIIISSIQWIKHKLLPGIWIFFYFYPEGCKSIALDQESQRQETIFQLMQL